MTAAEFDKRIREKRTLLEARSQSPKDLEEMLLERLRADMYIYESTVLEVIYAWRHYESDFDWRASEIPCPNTSRLIDAVFEYTAQRPMLRATIASLKGEISHEFGRIEDAVAAYMDSVDDLHEMHLDVDSKRIYSMMTLGHLLLSQGNKPAAEKLFLDVLSYPWYLVMEAELQVLLRGYYVKAGLGLIECRRGDLAALEEIFFVPAAQDDLLPGLKLVIDEARREIQ